MTDIVIEFLAGIFTLILFLIIAFYVYPRMKQEYKQKRWTWKNYYQTCGDDNRQSYRECFIRE